MDAIARGSRLRRAAARGLPTVAPFGQPHPLERRLGRAYGFPYPGAVAIPRALRLLPRWSGGRPDGSLFAYDHDNGTPLMTRVLRRYRRMLRLRQVEQSTPAFA